MKFVMTVAHFRVMVCLCVKTSPCKCETIPMKMCFTYRIIFIKFIFMWDSFWEIGKPELGNGLFFFVFSSKTLFVLYISLKKCPVYSLENGRFFTRLFVIDYRASLSSGREQAVYLPVMFSLIGITAGIVYWQAETPLQIITAYCGSSIPSILFLGSVLLSRINKSLEVSERHPRTQGLCSPWSAVGKRATLESSRLKSELK